jgi:hypothetical protein
MLDLGAEDAASYSAIRGRSRTTTDGVRRAGLELTDTTPHDPSLSRSQRPGDRVAELDVMRMESLRACYSGDGRLLI